MLKNHLSYVELRFVVSAGTITDEMIMEYIEKQDLEDKDGDFKRITLAALKAEIKSTSLQLVVV